MSSPHGPHAAPCAQTLKLVRVLPLIQDLNIAFKFHWRAARTALAGGAALLLPFLAAADSGLATGPANATLRAAAHLDFKIVIPRVLSLDVPGELHQVLGAQTVGVYSNSRSVAVGSTVGASDTARDGLVLRASARKVIAQNVACGPIAQAASLVCTASMP